MTSQPILISRDELESIYSRIERLEDAQRATKQQNDHLVIGWTRAAKMTGVCATTIKRRVREGEFPQPIKYRVIKDPRHDKRMPVWKRSQLYGIKETK